MREIFFFRHYITELQNPNIAALWKRWGAKGYGLYWHVLERLYADPAHMLVYNKVLHRDLAKAAKLSRLKVGMVLIDMAALRLINVNNEHITCDRVENEIKEVIKSKNRRKDVS
ncbi:Lin1244/Lin1753 domain-containing protein [Sphaerochaeta globosa]|uniref:Uncharacterized protein n=1 Tax=Sphaerochaeta globosa (strain ATCC BAA-1886 / DSM 22777 / Buddy) TaxID=158189 RepID=F0RWM3_SPHGB|nr:Lin1244/Lin1753 domain-containing protein [Sphaerochaeta globosa]ADY13654.1 hypothetical protein SpiBuddy_1830 [Sphaerochaeta globosa str. Buddy]